MAESNTLFELWKKAAPVHSKLKSDQQTAISGTRM